MTNLVSIARIELEFANEAWPFSNRHRAEIDAHFADKKRMNPALWNGQVLLLRDPVISDDVFRGVCFPVDYASFLAWRDWGFPDASARACVAQAALRAYDGAFLLGVMAEHTASAGNIHFPAGMPDLSDVDADTVNLHDSMLRELAEETGIRGNELTPDPRWHSVIHGPRVAHFKVVQSCCDADSLRNRILAYLARDSQSELADIRIVRSIADLDEKVAATTTAFLRFIWQ